MNVAAWVAISLIAVIDVFQLALALGAPAGAAAWGGSYPGVLPTRLRVASGFAAVLFYPAVAVLVLDSGGVIDVGWSVGPAWMWVLVGLFALGALANVVSRSKIERIWAPPSAAIAFCCGVIATTMQRRTSRLSRVIREVQPNPSTAKNNQQGAKINQGLTLLRGTRRA